MIAIINYGLGNLGSIRNMLKKLGHSAVITSDVNEIKSATRLILPGVGSFDYGMNQIRTLGLEQILHEKVQEEKVPILGICLGMQLLFKSSEEGVEPGLGWIDGQIVRFNFKEEVLKIPHMGWCDTTPLHASNLWENMEPEPRFYYVHSFHAQLKNEQDALLKAHYGYDFISGVEHSNIIGVQFHPEKSHKFGMRLLNNFITKFN